MKSPSISTPEEDSLKIEKRISERTSRGFSLIEIIVVAAVIVFIGSLGVIVGVDSYQRSLLRSDLDTGVSLLLKARSSAVNSIGGASHGVYLGGEESYILFRGGSYADRDIAYDFPVEKSKRTVVLGASEIIFSPPSGESASASLTLSNGIQSFTFTVNEEGGVDW